MSRIRSPSRGSRARSLGVSLCLRAFQVLAIAEGGLLPAILVIAVIHWTSGRADTLVAVVGATHGTVFTLYVVMVAPVARLLGWSVRTASVSVSVAFVPCATWVFEGSVRAEITRRLAESRACHLGADNCRFVAGPIHDTRIALLDHDGVVTRGDHTVDVDKVGLPHDECVALLVRRGPREIGHFLVTATTEVSYPAKERRRVTVLLADQVAVALDAD